MGYFKCALGVLVGVPETKKNKESSTGRVPLEPRRGLFSGGTAGPSLETTTVATNLKNSYKTLIRVLQHTLK